MLPVCFEFHAANEFHTAILLGPVFFRTALPCSGCYHLERGGCSYMMLLGDAVKRAQLPKIKTQVPSIWANGCLLDDCLLVIWLDMATHPWWREKVVVYYYNFWDGKWNDTKPQILNYSIPMYETWNPSRAEGEYCTVYESLLSISTIPYKFFYTEFEQPIT